MKILMPMLLAAALTATAAEYKDVVYSERPDGNLTLDAFVPDSPGPHPTAILVHGGGWVRGDKRVYITPVFPVFAQAGYAWFSIDYRLAPKHRFPDQVIDVEDAIRWVKANSAKYDLDLQRLVLVGESAGGHLVSWVGVTKGREFSLAAVIPFYAPNDLLGRAEKVGISENVQNLLGIGAELNAETRKALKDASPYYHVGKGLPPFLLIHGTADKQVAYEQSPAMQQQLRKMGNICDLYTVREGGHGMGSWAKIEQTWKTYIMEWLRDNLKAPAQPRPFLPKK
jgi:alpha-L-fucosidase 2